MNSLTDVGNVSLREDLDGEGGLDLRMYWTPINRYKWPILGFSLAVGVIAYLFAGVLTPVYQASARLLIEAQQANIVSIEQFYVDSNKPDYYQTQFQVMQSRQLAERTVDALKLFDQPAFDPARRSDISLARFFPFLAPSVPVEYSPAQRREFAIRKFRSELRIVPIRGTQVVDIQYQSTDSKLAALVANTLGDVYTESYLEAQLELTKKASSWLSERLKGMQVDLQVSERKLQEYHEQEKLVDIRGVKTLTEGQLQQVNSRLVEARNRTAIARSQYEGVQGAGGSYSERWETLPGVVKDAAAQSLKGVEAKADNDFSEIKQRYGPRHPKYINAEARLKAAVVAYQQRVSQVVRGFEEEYQLARAQQERTEDEVKLRVGEIQAIDRKEYELSELQRDADTNRQLYDMFFKRFRETDQTNFQSANARFIDRALPPSSPVYPQKERIVVIAVVLAFALGLGLAVLRGLLDNTIRVASEIEEKLGQVVLGVLPLEIRGKGQEAFEAARLIKMPGHAAFSESVRSLRTNLVLSGMEKPHQITVVTSSVPSEGKTTVASNLALAMGQMERVLLLDADMRRPSLGKAYGLSGREPGLSELVAQVSSLKECIHKFPDLGIDLLPAGTIPPNPLELLSSPRFKVLLDSLKSHYDRIVIDSPPTQAVSDSLVLSTHANALIYVIRSDSTAVNVVSNGLKRLTRVRAPLIGIVLNQFDASTAAKYGYDGYDRYGYYAYGYASKSYD